MPRPSACLPSTMTTHGSVGGSLTSIKKPELVAALTVTDAPASQLAVAFSVISFACAPDTATSKLCDDPGAAVASGGNVRNTGDVDDAVLATTTLTVSVATAPSADAMS